MIRAMHKEKKHSFFIEDRYLGSVYSAFQVTEKVLAAVYKALSDHHVYLEVI